MLPDLLEINLGQYGENKENAAVVQVRNGEGC